MKPFIIVIFSVFILSATTHAAAPDGEIEHLLQWTETVYTGSRPADESTFARLKEMGIHTLVSVDGAKPNIAAAEAAGLVYYHIPIGYDTVEPEAAAALVKVLNEKNGPFYVHCHHGLHRAPSIVAAAMKAADMMDNEKAIKMMQVAGTSEGYSGLWKSVAECTPDTITGLEPELHHVAPVAPIAEMMSDLDDHWGLLRACVRADWGVPPSQPDVTPQHEALLVWELFKRMYEEVPEEETRAYRKELFEATLNAEKLHNAIRDQQPDLREKYLDAVRNDCKTCHDTYRN